MMREDGKPTVLASLVTVASFGIAFLTLVLPRAVAEVRLTDVLGDNAVLQRDVPVPIWGVADSGETVTVLFADQEKETKADEFGRWRIELEPLPGSKEGRPLIVRGSANTIQVNNVRVGDVWLFLGRSFHLNERSLFRTLEPPAEDLPPIAFSRLSDIWPDRAHSRRPAAEFHTGGQRWSLYTPPGKYFAEYAFFLGMGLGKETQMPVGVMGLAGTHLESLTPPAGFEYYPAELAATAKEVATWSPTTKSGREAYLAKLAEIESWTDKARDTLCRTDITFRDVSQPPRLPGPPEHARAPTTQYNDIVYRYAPAAVRGIVIALGEYDVGDPCYEAKLKALIRGLRDELHSRDAPICVLQMHSPDQYQRNASEFEEDWPAMRMAQAAAMELPGVTVVACYDTDPKQREAIKMDQGLRVAQWAGAVVQKSEVKTGPLCSNCEFQGSACRVTFKNVGGGLMAGDKKPGTKATPRSDGKLHGFELQDAGGAWRPADAAIEGDTVVVSSSQVSAPTGVRYAWGVQPFAANLYNREAFPVLPLLHTADQK